MPDRFSMRFNSDEILDFDISEHPDREFLEEMAALPGRRIIIIADDENEDEEEPNDLVRLFKRTADYESARPARGSPDVLVSHSRYTPA